MSDSIRDRITRILDDAHIPAVDIVEDEPGGAAFVNAPGYAITDCADGEEPGKGLAVVAIVGRDGVSDRARQYERAGIRATATLALDKGGFTTEACGDNGDGILIREV
jgi:hypothetical protein